MADVATKGDAIRIMDSGNEVQQLHAVGTIHGVAIRQAAGACGPGIGRLASEGNGSLLRWRAPGSSTAGPSVDVSAGGQFLLLDGDDASAWLRIQVYTDFLLATPQAADVHLTDVFNNAVAADNVSASEASAGDVSTWTLTLRNDSDEMVTDITVWIDDDTDGVEISDDGSTWVSPTTEAAGLDLGDLVASAEATLHIRRTIAASSASDPDVTSLLHYSFIGT